MKRSIVTWLSILLCGSGAFAAASETTIQHESLPASVRDSLDVRYPGATIEKLRRETVKRVVLYEAELSLPEGRVDALFESDGRLREEERLLPASRLPPAVRRAVQRVTGGRGSILRAERLTSGAKGERLRFEVLVAARGGRTEYVFNAGGRLLKTQRDAAGD